MPELWCQTFRSVSVHGLRKLRLNGRFNHDPATQTTQSMPPDTRYPLPKLQSHGRSFTIRHLLER